MGRMKSLTPRRGSPPGSLLSAMRPLRGARGCASLAGMKPTAAVDEVLPLGKTVPLALQHVMAMYAGAVTVPLLVGSALGLSGAQLAVLISADLFTCGLATLLQTLGLGRHLGVRLPVMLGVSFVAVGPMIAIGKALSIQHVYGSILCAGAFMVLVSQHFGRLRALFPPLVTGCVVTTIGLSLLPVACNWMAGGIGAADYGAPAHLLLALLVLALVIALHLRGRGFLSSIAVLLGLVAGTIVAALLGKLDLSATRQGPLVALTTPFWFGAPRFDLAAALTMCLVGLVCMVESTGVFFAVARMAGVDLSEAALRRGLRAEGAAVLLGGCLNSFPYTTFSQNAGLVDLSRVYSRYVVAAAGGILIVLGMVPRFAALVAAVPKAVLGGAGLALFGMVAASGMRMLSEADLQRREHLFVIAISVGLGLGAAVVPQALAGLPPTARLLCGDGIVLCTLSAVILNRLVAPSKAPPA